MKRIICCISAAALLAGCACSCGSHSTPTDHVSVSLEMHSSKTPEEITSDVAGDWKISSKTINGNEQETPVGRYNFADNGNGLFYDENDMPHQVVWSITESGGIRLIYVETGETTANYEFISGDLVINEDTSQGRVETHLTKVPDKTEGAEADSAGKEK